MFDHAFEFQFDSITRNLLQATIHIPEHFAEFPPTTLHGTTVTREVYYITLTHFLVGENTALKEEICGDVLGHYVLEVLRGQIESCLTICMISYENV